MFCTRCGAVNSEFTQFCSACGTPLNQAGPGLAASAAAAPAFAPATTFRYAGFWKRFVAMVIDSLVLSPIVIALVAFSGLSSFVALQPVEGREGINAAVLAATIVVGVLIILAGQWVYHTWMESSRYQATLGKLALGIIVTDMDGKRISFARANARFFGKWISSMILNIGFLMAAFTEKKQALHDMLASCLVVMK
jgi:uncharacterized RDD family membrane protein YckC